MGDATQAAEATAAAVCLAAVEREAAAGAAAVAGLEGSILTGQAETAVRTDTSTTLLWTIGVFTGLAQ